MEVTTIRQDTTFAASPDVVYATLMNGELHGQFTHQKAMIGKKVGDRFVTLDGKADGTNLILEPGKRIVQSWRAHIVGWPEDHYSQVSYKLTPKAKGTHLTFLHERVPVEFAQRLKRSWRNAYWMQLKKLFDHRVGQGELMMNA